MLFAASKANVGEAIVPASEVTRSGEPKRQAIAKTQCRGLCREAAVELAVLDMGDTMGYYILWISFSSPSGSIVYCGACTNYRLLHVSSCMHVQEHRLALDRCSVHIWISIVSLLWPGLSPCNPRFKGKDIDRLREWAGLQFCASHSRWKSTTTASW